MAPGTRAAGGGTTATRRRRRGAAWTLLLLAPLAACGGGGAEPAPEPLFFLTSSDPPHGAQFVPLSKVFRILFNRKVDPSTIGPSAVTVRAEQTGTVTPGQATLDTLTQGIVWIPDHDLPGPLLHILTLDPALRSEEGYAVGGRLEIQFTTAAPTTVPGLPDAADLRALPQRLRVGRRSHTATRLPDDRVLLAGGFRQGASITDRAEIFDPLTETFTLVDEPMLVGRANHTATLLPDGRVLLAGGWVEAGPGAIDETPTAEVFDPATGLFEPVGSMARGRVDHAAHLLPDGTALVTGGSRLDRTPDGDFLTDFDDAEVFDPATGEFLPHAFAMSHTRATHGMVEMRHGLVALAGGSDVDLRPEVLDVTTGRFTPFAVVTGDRARFGAAMERFDSGGVVLVGGDDLGTVVYIAGDGSWLTSTGSALMQPRAYATATRLDPTTILVAGGLDVTAGLFITSSCDVLREAGVGGAETFPSRMRFFGGMAMHTATPLPGGRILFCGGLNADGTQPELDRAYLYEPD